MRINHPGAILRLIAIIITLSLTGAILSCNTAQNETTDLQSADSIQPITDDEIAAFQQAWGEGIVNIGKVFVAGGDFKAAASEHIHTFYNFREGTVLFKPTLTSVVQFRTDFEGALSYFVAGNDSYPEDHGFAIKPWSEVRWENIGTKSIGNMAVAMGNYCFTPSEGGDAVKVEYSFAYTRDESGNLTIVLHDSHLPYVPDNTH